MTDIQSSETHARTFDDFVNGCLTKGQWTHEAHLVTCWVALQTRTPREAIDFLRAAITAHNCGIGIENTAHSGYHETLTVYYVVAVANLIEAGEATRPEDLYEHPATNRTAPAQHWSRPVLFSPEARADWVEPDLAPLAWPLPS